MSNLKNIIARTRQSLQDLENNLNSIKSLVELETVLQSHAREAHDAAFEIVKERINHDPKYYD